MKTYRVYCATNTVNGKRYVGLTRGKFIQRKCQHHYKAFDEDSSYPFHVALREFGKAAFVWEILEDVGADYEIAAEAERRWMIKLNSRSSTGGGYNTVFFGADADPVTAEVREKMATKKRGPQGKRSAAARERLIKANELVQELGGQIVPSSHASLLWGWRKQGAKVKQLAALYSISNSAMCIYLRKHRFACD